MNIESLGEEDGLEEFKASNKIAIIDADTIVFAACVAMEYADALLPHEMYSDEEWDEILAHPNYDEDGDCVWRLNEDEAYESCVERIREIQHQTETKKVELYFTEGRNFRYKVHDMYKANRKGARYPLGLSTVKHKLLEEFDGEMCREYEADDKVVMLKRTQPNKYILCAVDKDVYMSVPGMHWNYYRSYKYDIEPTWVEVEAKDAYQFPYFQTLMGDSTDNIAGCKGVGKVGAAKALRGLVTPCDMWKAVVALFKKSKLTVKDAIRDMRLVNMHQLDNDGKTITLWEPPCEA